MDQVTLALWGLNKDYTVALVGLTGTLIGAVVAFLTMRYQVDRQEKEKQLDHATKECGQALLKLMRLFRKPEIQVTSTSGVTPNWEDEMTDQMDVLKLTAPLFQHKELRARLNATVDILTNWHYVTFDGPNRDEYEESSPVIRQVLQHAIDCLGAVRRGVRQLPAETKVFSTAASNIDGFWEWREEERPAS
ncbi:hypothetical protein [Streptomyces apricus]|uniref:Uncharacterized protein n=1 Tax=Streptomyces apricus TaxID=1828112 RepID=A0A5B0A461_9ACTN|nr:hypothetical protein [Streptomyces apricus]KAA0924260.1 hypothetical protein FGF04_33100 [Streptomyces apricus]